MTQENENLKRIQTSRQTQQPLHHEFIMKRRLLGSYARAKKNTFVFIAHFPSTEVNKSGMVTF